MIERNPFVIKSYEWMDSDNEYLQLFNSEALEPIDNDFLGSIQYVNSSPGAGKTSIFKAFSASVIRQVLESAGRESYRDLYNYYVTHHIIKGDRIGLLPCYISCARNYDSIEDDFTNGRRKHIFFALLNTRIIIACLRSFCRIKKLDMDVDLKRITFVDIPDEMMAERSHFVNGQMLFEWACEIESDLCSYLDGDEEEALVISFVHTTLLSFKLFESSCIRLDGEKCIEKTLLIFDDFHKLTKAQREYLIEAFYVLRPKAGVWFGQRFIGLETKRILSQDGMVDREYPEDQELNLENYWSNKKNIYDRMIVNIADRRLSDIKDMPHNFEDLLESKLNWEDYQSQTEKGIEYLIDTIKSETAGIKKYSFIFEKIGSTSKADIDKAKKLQVLLMLIRRGRCGQLSLDLGQLQWEAFEKVYKENQKEAVYYFSIDNNIPYYYGLSKLQKISSYNIEQFLTFAGEIFSYYKAKKIIEGNDVKVTPFEQQQLFIKSAEKRWKDILIRFTDGEQIQNMLTALCGQAEKERRRETNSYTGGTFSGIGIEESQMKKIIEDKKYGKLREVLKQCISAWYFEKRKVIQNNKNWIVFYYNRWICVKFKLPFVYGGWKPTTAEKLNECLSNKNVNLDQEYDYTTSLIGE